MAIRFPIILLMIIAILMLNSVAVAKPRALLVGVSSYPTLDKELRLYGPKNDVTRLHQVLLSRNFKPQDVMIFADGVADAQSPTRSNIINALTHLAQSAKSDDIIFIYFAGHGSQAPARRTTPEGQQEPDGLHEIFLPIDVGQWEGSKGLVRNAIIDYELRALVDQMLDRGAFVWGVFDACHSATMVRGGQPSEVKWRHINPHHLGMSGELLASAMRTPKDDEVKGRGGPQVKERQAPLGFTSPSSKLSKTGSTSRSTEETQPHLKRQGGSAFFYAAQTYELAPEIRLPIGDPQRKPYGLFSYMISQALELGVPMSYRQLMQYVLTQYAGIHQVSVSPVMTGTSPDQLVFGDTILKLRQWPISEPNGQIPVGTLSGIGVGDLFAVLPDATAKLEKSIGYMRVSAVELNSARLESIQHQGKAPMNAVTSTHT